MENIETIYRPKAECSLLKKLLGSELEETTYRLSNVSDENIKQLDKTIKKHYFHFGFMGKRTESINCIIYSRGGKSSISLYKNNKGDVEITHFYPDSTLGKILENLNLKESKITIED